MEKGVTVENHWEAGTVERPPPTKKIRGEARHGWVDNNGHEHPVHLLWQSSRGAYAGNGNFSLKKPDIGTKTRKEMETIRDMHNRGG